MDERKPVELKAAAIEHREDVGRHDQQILIGVAPQEVPIDKGDSPLGSAGHDAGQHERHPMLRGAR